MKTSSLVSSLIYIILVLGLIGSGSLVFEEIRTGEGCPKLWVIPMCMVIFICFLVPFIVQMAKKWNSLYFIFTGLAASIALIASIMQFTGNGECPKTDSGTPMCYYSLILFSTLIILKIKLSQQLKNS